MMTLLVISFFLLIFKKKGAGLQMFPNSNYSAV